MATPETDPHTTLRLRRRRQVGRQPALHLPLLCAAAVAAAALATAAGASVSAASTGAKTSRLDSPRLSQIVRGPALIPDSTISKRALRSFLPPGSYWGGQYTVSSGEKVTVFASNSYPQDPAIGQRWANFLAGLVHGPELSSLTAYLAPLAEVQDICGPSALACYGPSESALVAPGDDPATDISAEAVVTHEYGHHVAGHRSNAPWAAIDYGTKRWASYEQVCAKARRGQLFPGAERLPYYTLNPGEGFAETYRVLNERKAGLSEAPWEIVSRLLYPDDRALALLEQDVTRPWQGITTSSRTASLAQKARVRAYTFATPLDGTLKVTLKPPAGVRLALDVYSASSRLAHAVSTKTISRTTTICGQRSARIRVSAPGATGKFRLAIATP